MPVYNINEVTRAELYDRMFTEMQIPRALQPVLIALAARAMQNKQLYKDVENTINCPWYLVAAIHYRESNFSLSRHLHNGDLLTGRTIHVPKGRPVKDPVNGKFYSWKESAIDALLYDNLENTDGYTVGEQLLLLEQFNGVGYTKYRQMDTPYLWNYTQYYTVGKYESDGKFNPELKDKQAGCAPLIATIIEKNEGWV